MKLALVLAILLIFVGGCSTVQDEIPTTPAISGISELLLNEQDLQQLGMAINGTGCQTEEYQTSEYSPLAQYSICYYTIPSLNDTEVIIELKEHTNLSELNGSYQYQSLHYRSIDGLLSENDFGDQSRFYVNNENDYGAEYNPPGVYFYALYICKDEYLIYITSKGSEDAREYVAGAGRQILAKFG